MKGAIMKNVHVFRCFVFFVSLASLVFFVSRASAIAGFGAQQVGVENVQQALSTMGGEITRDEMVSRAWDWVNRAASGEPFPYNSDRISSSLKYDVDGQHRYGADCSGLVSMAWHLPAGTLGGTNTSGLVGYTNEAGNLPSWYDLRAGDILLIPSEHTLMFHAWNSDRIHFTYFTFGSSPPRRKTASIYDSTIDGHPTGNYLRRRYNKVLEGNAAAGDVAGDVDGDGKADLVSVHSDGNAYVWAGGGSGSFSGAVSSFSGTFDDGLVDGVGHLVVGVADVTGDGRADLVSVSSNGNAYVWPGRSDRRFGAAVSSFNGTMALATSGGGGHDPVAVADVTGDGLADLITVHTNRNVYVYPGRSNGSFGNGVAIFNATFDNAFRDGAGHWVVGAADVTGDGRADLVSVSSNGNAYVWPGRGDGSFSGSAVSSFNGTMALTVVHGQGGHVPVGVADVNGDGMADLVTHHTNGNVYVYRGSASGAFSGGVASFNGTMVMAQFYGTGHQVVGVMDVTGDGRADLVTATENGNAYVYDGTASGAFGSSTVSFAGTLDTSFSDTNGHQLVQMGPFPRRRVCPATGCRAR